MPKFLISNYLSNAKPDDIEGLRKYLIENSMMTKDYPEEGLILVYHKFDIPSLTEVERECRSLVLDRSNLKMVAYSCETPLMNMQGMDLVLAKQEKQPIVTECWEGSLLSMYKFNDKWHVSSRRCLDAKQSHVASSQCEQSSSLALNSASMYSLYDLMLDVLQNSGYETFSDFTDELNQEMSYYWVLLHHKNKHNIDYTSRLGDNYTKLCLISVRDNLMDEMDIYALEGQPYLGKNIFISPQQEFSDIAKCTWNGFNLASSQSEPGNLASSQSELGTTVSLEDFKNKPTTEGLAIKVWNEEMNKYNLVKLQTPHFQYNQYNNNNTMKGLIYLYQNGKLVEYLKNYPEHVKIQNPTNPLQSYDVVGVVDSAFKASSSELFELFKLLWSIQTGQRIPEAQELYESLPKEYKNMLYSVKGIYYRKKAELYNNQISQANVKNYHLKTGDIYNYLKSLSTDTLTQFWKVRKTMMESEQRVIFPHIQSYCDKIQLKLFAILINKL